MHLKIGGCLWLEEHYSEGSKYQYLFLFYFCVLSRAFLAGFSLGAGSGPYPRDFKARAGCAVAAVRSLKWRAVDCPNSRPKSIPTPENLFANAGQINLRKRRRPIRADQSPDAFFCHTIVGLRREQEGAHYHSRVAIDVIDSSGI